MINVIAEIGCNHKGEMEIAKELISKAHECGADVAKFQKRNNRELLGEEGYQAPHPNPKNSYGKTYGEHRDFLEFDLEQHRELKEYCERLGVVYATSVWDLTSAKEIASLKPALIKIPSAINTHYEMLQWLCTNYTGEIHLSVGMTTEDEINRIIELFERAGRNQDVVLYSCTSGYPVPYEDICLLEICRLKELFGHRVKAIGFSGHHLGVAIDSAATALGAQWIERHFTMDKNWKGTDHGASLEPHELTQLITDIRQVEKALTYKKTELLDIEKVQRDKLKFKNEK